MDFTDENTIKVVAADVLNLLGSARKHASTNDVRKVLRDSWSIIPQTNSFPYTRPVLFNGNSYIIQESKGRFYEIHREILESKFDDLMIE
jgi:hypothetical protein